MKHGRHELVRTPEPGPFGARGPNTVTPPYGRDHDVEPEAVGHLQSNKIRARSSLPATLIQFSGA